MVSPGWFLQIKEWGAFQKALGRRTFFLSGENWTSLLIRHELPLGKSYLYCPRGPIFQESGIKDQESGEDIMREFLERVQEVGQQERSIFFRWDPPLGDYKIQNTKYKIHAARSVQPQHTLVMDLTKPEEELLAGMHEKTRYNIRLAERRGVKVANQESGIRNQGVEIFWHLLTETAKRDKFATHSRAHYQKLFEVFGEAKTAADAPCVRLYIARFQEKPVAAAVVMFCGGAATYLHGASSSAHRDAMAPHLLHWRIMQDAKRLGYTAYDFWGIDDQNSAWAGITRFKRGFGGAEMHFLSSRDLVLNSYWYVAYRLGRVIRKHTS